MIFKKVLNRIDCIVDRLVCLHSSILDIFFIFKDINDTILSIKKELEEIKDITISDNEKLNKLIEEVNINIKNFNYDYNDNPDIMEDIDEMEYEQFIDRETKTLPYLSFEKYVDTIKKEMEEKESRNK